MAKQQKKDESKVDAQVELGQKDFEQALGAAKDIMESMGMTPEEKENADKMLEHLGNGGTLADLYNLGEKDLEVIYSFALNFYKNEKYADAISIFRYLCMNDHLTQKWWIGLGAAQQKSGDYQGAIQSYTMATMLDVEDPRPPLHGGYCLMMLGQNEQATNAFEHVVMVCDKKPEHAALKTQAEMLLGVVRSGSKDKK